MYKLVFEKSSIWHFPQQFSKTTYIINKHCLGLFFCENADKDTGWRHPLVEWFTEATAIISMTLESLLP